MHVVHAQAIPSDVSVDNTGFEASQTLRTLYDTGQKSETFIY